MAVQKDYSINPPAAKSTIVCLKVDVAGMADAKIADIRRKLEGAKSDIDAEIGPGRCRVEPC
jgi:hypothetical protein